MDQEILGSCQLDMLFIYAIIIGTLVIVGIIGNSLTFAVFWKGKFKASTSLLFMWLSFIDTTLLLTGLPAFSLLYVLMYMGPVIPLGLAKFILILVVVCGMIEPVAQAANVWLTLVIAMNRYIIVCLPLRASQWCTDRNVKIQVAVVLLIALLYKIAIGAVVIYSLQTAIILDTIFMLILPTCILALLNIRLIKALRAHRRMQNQSSQKDNSTTFVLIIVVVVLIVCQLPRIALPVLVLNQPLDVVISSGILCSVLPISNTLVVFNSAVNFFIYILFNKSFRDVLIQQVCKRPAPQQAPHQAPQQAPRHAVIAHEIADTERTDGEPVNEIRL